MFKKISSLVLFSVFLFGGCSKTNPHFERKERVVEKDLNTYEALTASQEINLLDEDKIPEIISNIRLRRRPDFDWKHFWFQGTASLNVLKVSPQSIREIFSLAKLSCDENPSTSHLILKLAQKNLSETLGAGSSERSLEVYKAFMRVTDDCGLSEDDSFLGRYKEVLETILKKGNQELKLLALFHLNGRLETTKNEILIKDMRILLTDKVNLGVSEQQLGLKEKVLLAHLHKILYPYKSNPFLQKILSDPDPMVDLEGLMDSFAMLSTLRIPKEKLPEVSSFLLRTMARQFSVPNVQSSEEQSAVFDSQYEASEIILSFLQKELSAGFDKVSILRKVETLVRSLESSLFTLAHIEDVLMKKDGAINLMLDLRHSKKTSTSLILDSQSVNEISDLEDVFRLFHRIHQGQDQAKQIGLFCNWMGSTSIVTSKQKITTNGCFDLKVTELNQKIKIISETVITPMFSVFRASGADLSIKARSVDLGVLDLSQQKSPEASPQKVSSDAEAILFPLVLGIELSEDFLDLKKDRLYYFPYHYLVRGNSAGAPQEEDAADGFRGGNLKLELTSQGESFLPSFLSEGSAPARTLPGNPGGKRIDSSIDLFNVEEWVSAASSGEVYSLSDLSVKNLERLFSKVKRNNQNQKIVKVENDFLKQAGSLAQGTFEGSLVLAREKNIYTGEAYLEEISTDALSALMKEIETRIANGDELARLPTLNFSYVVPQGAPGSVQRRGEQGARGVMTHE